MHQRYIHERSAAARSHIRAASDQLAAAFGLAPLEQPTPLEQRTPAIAQMRELEHVANLLDALARAVENTPNGSETSATERPRPRGRSASPKAEIAD